MDENITLEAGAVTCRTCHSGLETENHFLLSHYGSDRICGHCHVTELECPGEKSELQSVCFPGLLNGGVRCVFGKDIILLPGTSEFCADCHGGIESMSRSHPVDIQYPLNRPGFTPISELDANIELENGHITCRSCHEKRDEGMSLCVECHPR